MTIYLNQNDQSLKNQFFTGIDEFDQVTIIAAIWF